MKYMHIAVKFSNYVADLQKTLSAEECRNIMIQPTCDGWLRVRYDIKNSDPRVVIERLIKRAGAQPVGFKSTADGADFDFRIDEHMDEKAVRKQVITQIENAGYFVN